jgi:hypothetical protein
MSEELVNAAVDRIVEAYQAPKPCEYCGATDGCIRDKGWPCTREQADAIARRAGYGVRPGDYRSYWD